MSPVLVLDPKIQLKTIYEDSKKGKTIITDILDKLKILLEENDLIDDIKLIGIANDVMLGVFQLVKIEGGYECRRMVIDNDNLLISDIGYPVSNIGKAKYNIECNLQYIINVETLRML